MPCTQQLANTRWDRGTKFILARRTLRRLAFAAQETEKYVPKFHKDVE